MKEYNRLLSKDRTSLGVSKMVKLQFDPNFGWEGMDLISLEEKLLQNQAFFTFVLQSSTTHGLKI